MKTYTKIIPFVIAATTPLVSFAQVTTVSTLAQLAGRYFDMAIFLIIDLAILMFIWNVYRYFFKADVENKKEAGLYVMYSVIGFFIILSFWGLVNILKGSIPLDTNPPASLFGNQAANNTFNSNASAGTAVPAGNPSLVASQPSSSGSGGQRGILRAAWDMLFGSGK